MFTNATMAYWLWCRGSLVWKMNEPFHPPSMVRNYQMFSWKSTLRLLDRHPCTRLNSTPRTFSSSSALLFLQFECTHFHDASWPKRKWRNHLLQMQRWTHAKENKLQAKSLGYADTVEREHVNLVWRSVPLDVETKLCSPANLVWHKPSSKN